MKYKPLPLEIASYPLTGGVDSKIQGLVLPPPKLQTCINAYVEQTGSIRRRFGRSALSVQDISANTITNWIASATYQDRLIGFTSSAGTGKLYDYSTGAARWVDKSRCTSWRLRATSVDAGNLGDSLVGGAKDMAVTVSGYRCYAYDYFEPSGANLITYVAFSLVDANGTRLATNQILTNFTAAAALASGVKVVAHGSVFYIVYWDVTTANGLRCFRIDTTSAASIATSLAGSATAIKVGGADDLGVIGGVYAPLDLVDDLWHGPFVCYRSTTANTIHSGIINTSGALVNSNNISSGATNCVTISCDSISIGANTILIGVAFTQGVITNDVFAALRSFNGTTWTSVATSGAMDTAIAAALTRTIACKFDSATVLRVFYDADTNVTYPCLRQGTYSTGGTIVSRDQLLPRSYIASKPFIGTDGFTYLWVINEESAGKPQPTMFLMRHDGTLAGVAHQGTAVQNGLTPYGLGRVTTAGNAGVEPFSFFCDYLTRIGTNGIGSTSASHDLTLDMNHAQSHGVVADQSCLYIPSGIYQQYDGFSTTEVGFLVFNDTQGRINLGAGASTNGAGSLDNTAGTVYGYRVIPEWTNAQGEREQGTDNGPGTTAAFAAGDDTITFTIDCIPWTLKTRIQKSAPHRQNLVFAVYRTLKNPTASSPHFRVGTIPNNPAVDTVTFVDLMSDAVASTQEQLKEDTELDQTAPPPGYITCAGVGRVFIAGFADDPNLVVYSKLRGHGEPLAFSDALNIPFPAAAGPIMAMCVFAESLVVFTEGAIYRVNGGGLSNTGATGGFTDPVVVQSDAGALGQRGVVVTPGGVMYESVRGKMLLTPNFTIEYIGAPLEQLSAPGTCTGSTLLPALQQVRFSYAATTHVYDYYHRQWYVFTHHSDGPTCLWNGTHTAVDAGIVHDDTMNYKDVTTNYAVTLTLAWMHGSSLLSDLDIRTIGLTGQILASTYLTLYVAIDQLASNQTIDNTYTSTGGLSQQWRIKKQVCKQMEITIRDAILDAYGFDVVQADLGWRLEELSFELAPRSLRFGRGPGTVLLGI